VIAQRGPADLLKVQMSSMEEQGESKKPAEKAVAGGTGRVDK
jgi:hypothetical protein